MIYHHSWSEGAAMESSTQRGCHLQLSEPIGAYRSRG